MIINKKGNALEEISKYSNEKRVYDKKIATILEELEKKTLLPYQRNELRNQLYSYSKNPILSFQDKLGYIKECFHSKHLINAFTKSRGICSCVDEGVYADINITGGGMNEGRARYGLVYESVFLPIRHAFEGLKLKFIWANSNDILLPREYCVKLWRKMALKSIIRVYHSHRGCGAAKVDLLRIIRINLEENSEFALRRAMKQFLVSYINKAEAVKYILSVIAGMITSEMVDAHAKNYIKKISEEVGVPHEHIDMLDRPAIYHPGEILYFDFRQDLTYSFHPEKIGMPQGYTLQAAATKFNKSIKRAALVTDIVFGPSGAGGHGFVNPDNKFLVIMLHDPGYRDSVDIAKNSLLKAINHPQDSIHIESFQPYKGKVLEFEKKLKVVCG
ncbi:MAG: hypothetical protein ACK4NC_06490 [Candidatus Gracilibacteria bacterium]